MREVSNRAILAGAALIVVAAFLITLFPTVAMWVHRGTTPETQTLLVAIELAVHLLRELVPPFAAAVFAVGLTLRYVDGKLDEARSRAEFSTRIIP